MKRTIFHVDVNSAFLSWEAAYRIHHLGGRLDLRDIPSAIGGDVKMRHGIILAKSIPAKPYGIQTGMTIPEAIRRCPKLYLAPPNYSLYERCSRAFLKILKNYTPDVEVYSIDEAFLDMTETLSLFGTAEATADMIRKRIWKIRPDLYFARMELVLLFPGIRWKLICICKVVWIWMNWTVKAGMRMWKVRKIRVQRWITQTFPEISVEKTESFLTAEAMKKRKNCRLFLNVLLGR